jgi:hypothetical protein
MDDTTYLIDEYKTEITIEPYTDDEPTRLDKSFPWMRRPIPTNYQGPTRDVYPESVGSLLRTVRFAPENQCSKPFEIRYTTLADGALSIAHSPDRNLFTPAPNAKGARAERVRERATEVDFHFDPAAARGGSLDLKIYKGFDRGNRNAHFHLKDNYGSVRRYQKMKYMLDLTAYQRQGFALAEAPGFWHQSGVQHTCTGRVRLILQDDKAYFDTLRVAPSQSPSSPSADWKWTWELEKTLDGHPIEDGYIDLIWEHALVPPYDLFISHAGEDKQDTVEPLRAGLIAAGVTSWYDTDEMIVGDHVLQSIVRGIGNCAMGVVVLSPSFFKKSWTITELSLFLSHEKERLFVLPVLHGMSINDLREKLTALNANLALEVATMPPNDDPKPALEKLHAAQKLLASLDEQRAARRIASTEDGLDRVTEEIVEKVAHAKSR